MGVSEKQAFLKGEQLSQQQEQGSQGSLDPVGLLSTGEGPAHGGLALAGVLRAIRNARALLPQPWSWL